MSKIPISRLCLRFSASVSAHAPTYLLRGALASAFPEEPLLHQHKRDGVIYRYPLIQYRWWDGNGIVIGFHEGACLLPKLPLLEHQFQLGNSIVRIIDIETQFAQEDVKPASRLLRYRFMSPWLPLDQENFEKYKIMSQNQRADERDRIIVGNLLTALRGLNIEFPDRLYATVQVYRTVTCFYKGQRLLGFMGRLLTNVLLPDDLAVGRAVSHGYGWLKRVNDV